MVLCLSARLRAPVSKVRTFAYALVGTAALFTATIPMAQAHDAGAYFVPVLNRSKGSTSRQTRLDHGHLTSDARVQWGGDMTSRRAKGSMSTSWHVGPVARPYRRALSVEYWRKTVTP